MGLSCKNCRVKKIRCSGEKPACLPCITKGIDCAYATERATPQALLSRGEACLPCRSKKKKCNGARPYCRTCVIAKKEHLCAYETITIPVLLERNRQLEEQLKALQAKLDAEPTTESAVVPELSRSTSSGGSDASSSLDSEPQVTYNFQSQGHDAGVLQLQNTTALTIPQSSALVQTYSVEPTYTSVSTDFAWINNSSALPTSTIYDPTYSTSYIPFNSIPAFFSGNLVPNPPVIYRELVSPQETHLARARTYALSHGVVFNLRFTQPKTEALMHGDISGTYIRPAVVHATHVWGLALLARAEGSAIDGALVASYLSMAQAALMHPLLSREDAVDDVEALSLLTLYAFNLKNVALGTKWVLEAVATARQAGLGISLPLAPGGGVQSGPESARFRMPATPEEQERDTMVNLVLIDFAGRMVISAPSRVGDVEQEWTALMTYCEEHFESASVQTIRLTSICILFETFALLPKPQDSPSGIQPGTHPVNPTFIRRARRFLAHLEGPILAFSAIADHPVFTVLQECAIIVNTALLFVYLELARHGYDEGKRKGVAAILEIVSITKTMRPEELDCLDPFGVICWSATLQILSRERKGFGPLGGLDVHAGNIDAFMNTLRLARYLYVSGCVQFSTLTWVDIMREIEPAE